MMMYGLDQLRRGIIRGLENPSYFGRELNRLYYRQTGQREFNTDGVDIMMSDWDVLVILDACRYDIFSKHYDLPGELERRQSRGSHTAEFLAANFSDGKYMNTAYITSSPQLYRHQDELDASFHAVEHVWRDAGWNDEHGTVMPETMTEYALKAAARYPNKRLILHYLQPHYPFIGAPDLNTRQFGSGNDDMDIWNNLMRGNINISSQEIWQAYKENLCLALEAVKPIFSEVEGRIVVTSDHGNMFGSRSQPIPVCEWGHPPGIHTPELVQIPWLIYDDGQRRTIVSNRSDTTQQTVSKPTVEDRLQDLGYI